MYQYLFQCRCGVSMSLCFSYYSSMLLRDDNVLLHSYMRDDCVKCVSVRKRDDNRLKMLDCFSASLITEFRKNGEN